MIIPCPHCTARPGAVYRRTANAPAPGGGGGPGRWLLLAALVLATAAYGLAAGPVAATVPASAPTNPQQAQESTLAGAPFAMAGEPTLLADDVIFGDERSEQKHALTAELSEVFPGALDLPSRRLLPGGATPWAGGTVSFTMKVDPHMPTYFTAKFWGGEANANRLVLYCEGKQVGYRHLGDVDMLDIGETDEPPYNGRFYYVTTPLPVNMTEGKSELHFEIHSLGPIFAYGTTFDQFQKPMDGPARAMYRAYTHTAGCFIPPADEKQGAEPPMPTRNAPGEEVLREMQQHLVGSIDKLLASGQPLNQSEALLLGRAYNMKWSPAYRSGKAADQVVKSVDALYAGWKKAPKSMLQDSHTPNPGWFAAGPAAEAVEWMAKAMGPALDQKVAGETTRRAQWVEMFIESRDWLRKHRRLYTNQSMIVDLNIYRSNRAIAALDPGNALAEDKALHYLYESAGLQPWLGSDTDHGPEKPMGDDYYQLTDKGLSKELGYVGNYGEVLDWLTQIYNVTRPEPAEPGDKKLFDQLVKVTRARGAFRYPMLDADGSRAMRIETLVGWRDHHYPGPVVYAQVARRDGSAIGAPAVTLDPQAVGYVQQMFADNQFFASLADMLKKRGLFETIGMLNVPDDYEAIRMQPPSSYKLPMSAGQPDFVFSDEEDGVVALKNGTDILYASLYWRANHAVNFLGRVHYITPYMDRVAVVREETKFVRSGLTWTRPDDIQILGAPWIPRYPVNTGSAEAGEELPVARIPAGISFHQGQESIYAGKGDFYTLRYGSYLIGMNLTKNQDFDLDVPTELHSAKELVSGKTLSLSGSVKVGPKSTVVLCTGSQPAGPNSLPGSR